jgi:hypothetical protein
MTMNVRSSKFFISWILGLGGEVEILEPESLRETVLGMAYSIIASNRKEKVIPVIIPSIPSEPEKRLASLYPPNGVNFSGPQFHDFIGSQHNLKP